MLRLIAAAIYLLFTLFVSGFLFMPLAVILRYACPGKAEEALVGAVTRIWGRGAVLLAGGRVRVHGKENLPADRRVCFVANHQEYADIVLFLGWIGRNVGFVGKQELGAVPILSTWMRLLHSLFLDRASLRQGLGVMHRGARNVRKGHAMVIFPEGHRSQGGPLGEFKAGSFKMSRMAGGYLVPVTIDGSWRFLYHKGKVTGGPIDITIHPAIDVEGLSPAEWKEIPARVRETIAAPIRHMPASEAAPARA